MTLCTHGVPMFFRRSPVPITPVNLGLEAAGQNGQTVFPNIPIGAEQHSNRRVFVALTAEAPAGGTDNVSGGTFGGAPLSLVDSLKNDFTFYGLWEATVPSGDHGDLVLTLERSPGVPAYFDSIGVTTLVTTMADGPAVDVARVGTGFAGSLTVSNVETAAPGFLLAVSGCTDEQIPFGSMAGNGSNGALTKIVDVRVANDHRHAVWLRDDTEPSVDEDYTCVRGTNNRWGFVMASWSY